MLTVYRYVEFAMSRVRMLIYFGVTPYLVFDGDNLPSKAGTESDRAKRREESKKRGLELYRAGKMSQAQQELQKAVDVTPYMARQLIEELKRQNIQYVVAPYEADAQLAYLERKGIINGVLSEDSDLLVFGVKRLLTKLDQHGDCVEINRADFASCRDISLIGWTDADFRCMAILSGCDYLPSINKMGLKTAYRYVRKYKTAEKVLRMLQFEGQLSIPAGYLEKYQHAELTFLHHRVFCPITKKLVFLTDLEPGTREDDLPFIGEDVEAETAVGVACGDLHPTSKQPIHVRAAPSSSRSAVMGPRRQTLPSTADLKPTKSLDSFFKPRRQPLAELDPNSLTPSPSQQRLLEVNANTSWEARTTSSAPQLRTSTSLMQEAVRPKTTNRATFLAQAGIVSSYQPPKRQRLCSDADDAAAASKSRFFDSNVEELSPSVRRPGKIKKARRSDFGIFSDDSVDDILLGLPDVEEPVSYPKLDTLAASTEPQPACADHDSGYFDDTQNVPETSPIGSAADNEEVRGTRETSPSSTYVQPQPQISQGPTVTAVNADNDPGAFVDLLEYHVRKQNEILQKTFIGQSPSRRADALRTLRMQPGEESSSTENGRVAGASMPPVGQNSIAASVLPGKGSNVTLHESLKNTFAYQASPMQKNALKSLARTQDRKVKVNVGAAPSGLPMTPLQRLGQQALRKTRSFGAAPADLGFVTARLTTSTTSDTVVTGPSEDLIMPTGEDESGGDEEAHGTLRHRIEFAKFTFTAK